MIPSEERPVWTRAALGIGLVLLGSVVFFRTVAVPWAVAGDSMEPALRNGDRVIVDVWSYRQRPPRPGEIALFALGDGILAVKRVGLPPRGRSLPPDSRWVLGDNPALSGDSREFGPVSDERFRGRVVWRYWPPGRAGRIR